MVTSNTYADQFKPALLFGIPRLSNITSNIYLSKNLEQYAGNNSHMAQVSSTGKSNDKEGTSGFYYALETANPAVCPTVRPVSVIGKKEFTNCFLIEPALGATGITVLMFAESQANGINEIYCNLRVLPYSTFMEVLDSKQSTSTAVPGINIPKTDVIKLNVTLTPSDTGEALYRTNSCEVNLETTGENDKIALAREFEFELAKFVAQICSSMLHIAPAKSSDKMKAFTSNYHMKLEEQTDSVLKETLLGAGLIGCSATDLTGVIAIRNITPDWRFAGLFISEVLI